MISIGLFSPAGFSGLERGIVSNHYIKVVFLPLRPSTTRNATIHTKDFQFIDLENFA